MGEAQRAGEEPCEAGAAEPGQGHGIAPSAAGEQRGHAWGELAEPSGLSARQDEAALRGELVRHGV